jgi:hypothetical protein
MGRIRRDIVYSTTSVENRKEREIKEEKSQE